MRGKKPDLLHRELPRMDLEPEEKKEINMQIKAVIGNASY